jgi:Flp pilus assembly protein TadD
MKIKPIYIYAAVIVVAILLLIIFTTNTEKTPDTSLNQMPQDEIHKGLMSKGQGGPSGSNVSEEIRKKMESLKEGYESDPNDTIKIRQYADFLSMAHKQNDAITLYEKILNKDPKRTDVRLKLSLLYFHRQDLVAAEKVLNDVFKYDKNNARAKFNLAIIIANKGDKEKAKNLLNEIIKENPNSELAKMSEETLRSISM